MPSALLARVGTGRAIFPLRRDLAVLGQQVEVQIVNLLLLQLRQHELGPCVRVDQIGLGSVRQDLVLVLEVQTRRGELLHVVDALHAAGGLARRLDGWQQQRDQQAHDGDHDQQLNQREAMSGAIEPGR
ncbi:MAG: hypothetical protein CMJ58_22745 [Planctomycetaceae bacterium]|nr:hypothetical protein [Planctomycetaceae bacterium]